MGFEHKGRYPHLLPLEEQRQYMELAALEIFLGKIPPIQKDITKNFTMVTFFGIHNLALMNFTVEYLTKNNLGSKNGALGYPISDEHDIDEGRQSDFEKDHITWLKESYEITVFVKE